MRLALHPSLFLSAFGWLVAGGWCQAQDTKVADLERKLAELRQQNATLQKSLAEANAAEKQSAEQLVQVRQRLAALGKNLLDGGDDRLVQAAADIQLLNERITLLEGSTMRLLGTLNDYLSKAVASDPESRARVESSIRELDVNLGLRQKPRPDVKNGSLQQARVVSKDPQSGLLILNVGEAGGARIGMTFRLHQGQQPYAKAIVADVRKNVSGLFVEKLDRPDAITRVGDQAILETE